MASQSKTLSKNQAPVIVWFRQDLRLSDHPALQAAAERDVPLCCLFILDEQNAGDWAAGGARKWWLHHTLEALQADLRSLGQTLVLRKGPASDVLDAVLEETGADTVVWNRLYEPAAVERDKDIKSALKERGVTAESFPGSLLREPWEVMTGAGEPYRVFTAYWKASLAKGAIAKPLPRPSSLPKPTKAKSDDLDDWALLPTQPDWAGGLREIWTPGEKGALDRLDAFLDDSLEAYADGRDRPDQQHTSMLSPHLHHGEISPRTVWHRVHAWTGGKNSTKAETNADKFLSEIGWREFSYQLLFHNADLPDTALRPEFRSFPWAKNKKGLEAWQKGRTGYPIVDAGMRQLWHTGWMHNRVRMIVGSVLVKHLLIPWQEGEAWFWDTLVDADLANNSAGWQWIAGCGADAAPYFRVFNPVLQGEKFDPKGEYVRRWVPELKDLPAKHIHKPWEAPESVLEEAGVTIGKDYPAPIIGLKEGRERALEAFASIKSSAA